MYHCKYCADAKTHWNHELHSVCMFIFIGKSENSLYHRSLVLISTTIEFCIYRILNRGYVWITKTVHVKSASASAATWRRAARDAASMGRNPTLNQSCDFLLWTRAIGRPRLCSLPPTGVRKERRSDWLPRDSGGGWGRGPHRDGSVLFSNFLFLFLGG